MILLARGLSRLSTFLLLVALAVVSAAAAVGSLSTGADGTSLPGLSAMVRLDRVSDDAGGLLGQLEADGSIAILSALGGAGAILAGVILLVGLLWPRRERLVVLRRDEHGVLAGRRRALGQVATALADGVQGVRTRRVRLRPKRRGRPGGKIKLRAVTSGGAPVDRQQVTSALDPLTSGFGLRDRVRLKAREK